AARRLLGRRRRRQSNASGRLLGRDLVRWLPQLLLDILTKCQLRSAWQPITSFKQVATGFQYRQARQARAGCLMRSSSLLASSVIWAILGILPALAQDIEPASFRLRHCDADLK